MNLLFIKHFIYKTTSMPEKLNIFDFYFI